MDKLKTTDLLSLEEYDKQREDIKKDLLLHKKKRSVLIGDNVVLLFEDYLTIKYQVQEMLRIEKIFNPYLSVLDFHASVGLLYLM